MYLGKIVGTVVATRKDERLVGHKMLVVQPLAQDLSPKGDTIVAVDTVGAGIGETIIFTKGTAARNALNKPDSPIDASIVGIVDNIDSYDD